MTDNQIEAARQRERLYLLAERRDLLDRLQGLDPDWPNGGGLGVLERARERIAIRSRLAEIAEELVGQPYSSRALTRELALIERDEEDLNR